MKDDFWDIDKLLPYRPSHRSASPYKDIETHEINNGKVHDGSVPLSELTSCNSDPENVCEYDYSTKSLILKTVIISDWQASYSYSNDFYSNAHKAHTVFPEKDAPYTPFFSYMPQYSDLTSSQYAFYLSWRDSVKHGIYPKTDVSYIFLYLYELFALDDILDHSESLNTIIDLWSAYRGEPALDKHLCEWIVDYALIHNIQIPLARLSPILPQIHLKQHSLLFNIYLFDYLFISEERITADNIKFLCDILCNYSPFTTKYYNEEAYRNVFDECTVGIFRKMYGLGYFSSGHFEAFHQDVKLSRPSYLSAVCSAKNKKNITIIYRPYISSELLKITFSNIMKYIENRIRIHFGYKSRLSGTVPNDGLRSLIDEFMKLNYPPPSKSQKNLPEPPPARPVIKVKKLEIDFEKARRIEDDSWQTTEKLTEGLEISYDDEPAEELVMPDVAPVAETEECSLAKMLTPLEKETIRMILNGAAQEEIQSFLLKQGALPDAIMDSVNEKALEAIGDIVIDTSDYTPISEYIDELSSF